MVEFNSDGSIKLPSKLMGKKAETDRRMKSTMCVKIEKEVISEKSPKQCILHLTLSDAFTDGTVVEKAFYYFQRDSETPVKLIKKSTRNWDIEIGTSLKRCNDCFEIINRFKSYLEDNVIIDKGTCYFEPKSF